MSCAHARPVPTTCSCQRVLCQRTMNANPFFLAMGSYNVKHPGNNEVYVQVACTRQRGRKLCPPVGAVHGCFCQSKNLIACTPLKRQASGIAASDPQVQPFQLSPAAPSVSRRHTGRQQDYDTPNRCGAHESAEVDPQPPV